MSGLCVVTQARDDRFLGLRGTLLLSLLALICLVCSACTEQKDTAEDTYAQQLANARKLNSLPYVAAPAVREENRGLHGVVRNEPGLASPGLNLYGSMTRHRAYLIDMNGEVVHRWQADNVLSGRREFVLGEEVLNQVAGLAPGFAVAEIHGDCLLAIEPLGGLVKLDRDSNLLFELPNGAHHDVDTAADGSILVLTAAPRWVEVAGRETIILDNLIERVSPDGKPLQSYSLFEILAENESTRPQLAKGMGYTRYWLDHLDQWQETEIQNLPGARPGFAAMFGLFDEAYVRRTRPLKVGDARYVLSLSPADVLHANTVDVLPGRRDGLWHEGNVLVSIRNLDLIVVLDLAAREVVWTWGPGVLSRQHQPSLQANGNLLIFDNGTARGRSRVVEMDPVSGEIVWSYGETDATRFFCAAMGGAQALPNGNVLITEPFAGRAFEVQRNGHVVWDFFNPDRGYNPFDRQAGTETIESLYRLVRVDSSVLAILSGR